MRMVGRQERKKRAIEEIAARSDLWLPSSSLSIQILVQIQMEAKEKTISILSGIPAVTFYLVEAIRCWTPNRNRRLQIHS